MRMFEFEWDPEKAESNLKKHGVSFEEAKSVFYDDFAIQFYDEAPGGDEERFILLGMSSLLRILTVVHCERGNDNILRIISARKATKTE